MKKIVLSFLLAIAPIGLAQGTDSYTLTSYYPAPHGTYNTVETTDMICRNDTIFEGNLGIGTTSSSTLTAQNLVVNDQSLFSGDVYINHSANDPFLQLQRSSGTAFWLGNNTASNKLDIRISSAAADQVFTVTRTGQAGIGLNSNWIPAATLDVTGDAYISLTATIDGATTINNVTTLNGATTIVDNAITLTRSASGGNAQAIFSNASNNAAMGNNNSGEFRFSPQTNSITDANVIITAAGLGINTAPGTDGLNASGTANISGSATFSGRLTAADNIITTMGLLRIKNILVSQGAASASGVSVDTLVSSNIIAAPEFLHSSDERLKEDIAPITDALAKVKALKGVSFHFKAHPGRKTGLIAQNVEAVMPEVVVTGRNGMKSVEYDSLVGLLIEAIKEQQLEIARLKRSLQERSKKPHSPAYPTR